MTTLKEYQYQGAKQIRRFGGRALLADEMGLGKSLTALYYCWRTEKFPVVVVCPASLKFNWEREAATHLNLMAEVLEGQRVRKLKPLTRHPVIIVNYEVLGAWIPYLRKLQPKVLIVDEVHYIKNRKSKRYKAVLRLSKRFEHVVALSGTPLTNRPVELWPTLRILLPDKFGSFFEYAHHYCRPKHMPWGWEFTGAKNLPELHRQLKELCMIRRLKKDVLKELPAKVRRVIPLALSDRREYVEATNDFLGWLKKQSPERARKAKRSEALVRVGYLLRLCARLKVSLVFDWVDNYLEGCEDKIVLFTMHRKMVDLLHERYKRRCVVVDGRVKGKKRMDAVDQFQRDPRVRVFVGNVRAAGVGLNLTRAPVCAYTDLPWTPGDLVQGEDRIHRIGQNRIATIYYLVAINTIEEKLCQLLREKQSVLESVLDGGEGDDLDIFKELLTNLTRKRL